MPELYDVLYVVDKQAGEDLQVLLNKLFGPVFQYQFDWDDIHDWRMEISLNKGKTIYLDKLKPTEPNFLLALILMGFGKTSLTMGLYRMEGRPIYKDIIRIANEIITECPYPNWEGPTLQALLAHIETLWPYVKKQTIKWESYAGQE